MNSPGPTHLQHRKAQFKKSDPLHGTQVRISTPAFPPGLSVDPTPARQRAGLEHRCARVRRGHQAGTRRRRCGFRNDGPRTDSCSPKPQVVAGTGRSTGRGLLLRRVDRSPHEGHELPRNLQRPHFGPDPDLHPELHEAHPPVQGLPEQTGMAQARRALPRKFPARIDGIDRWRGRYRHRNGKTMQGARHARARN